MSFKEQVSIGYAKEVKVLGAIVEISFLEETVVLMSENGDLHKVSFDEVVELDEIGIIGQTCVYNHDVLSTEDGRQYEVYLDEEDKMLLHPLDANLERVNGMLLTSVDKELINQYTGVLAVVGNIFELREKLPKVDFNLATVRHIDENDGEVTYYQVGNLVDTKEVDLVKAIMFEDTPYERITLSHSDFLESVATGEFKIVDPMELENYLTGLFYGQEEPSPELTTVTDDTIEGICQECGEQENHCDCDLWIK